MQFNTLFALTLLLLALFGRIDAQNDTPTFRHTSDCLHTCGTQAAAANGCGP